MPTDRYAPKPRTTMGTRIASARQAAFSAAQTRPLAGHLILALRLCEAPVIDISGSADALGEERALLTVRIKLEPERLLNRPPLRTHVPMVRTRSDPTNGNPLCGIRATPHYPRVRLRPDCAHLRPVEHGRDRGHLVLRRGSTHRGWPRRRARGRHGPDRNPDRDGGRPRDRR